MRFATKNLLMRRGCARPLDSGRTDAPGRKETGFTLVEVMVVMALLTALIVGCFGSILCLKVVARRTADFTAGMALAESKIHDIRAVLYSPTNTIFSSVSATTNIDSVAVDLNSAGTTFQIPGTVISTIKPITWGHLVTVQVIIRESQIYQTNTLQTVVNTYSGGRGTQ